MMLAKSESIVHSERRGKPFDFEPAYAMRELELYVFKMITPEYLFKSEA